MKIFFMPQLKCKNPSLSIFLYLVSHVLFELTNYTIRPMFLKNKRKLLTFLFKFAL